MILIIPRSFRLLDRRRFRWCSLVLCFIILFTICSMFDSHLHNPPPLYSYANEAGPRMDPRRENTEPIVNPGAEDVDTLSIINTHEDALQKDLGSENSEPTVNPAAENPHTLSIINTHEDALQKDLGSENSEPTVSPAAKNVQTFPVIASRMLSVKKPLCRVLEAGADYCEMDGDIRIEPTTTTVFVIAPNSGDFPEKWTVQPYPRKGTSNVKNWTITLSHQDDYRVPKCSINHRNTSAILFSIGGFSGNHFHDFADLILPLYATSVHFKKEVHFLVTDYVPWWPSKFQPLLEGLTRYELIDIDSEKQVHCYKKMVAGLEFYKELIVSPSSGVSMRQFREYIRRTYSLHRTKVMRWRATDHRPKPRPRLMIISRKQTRILTNEVEISKAATKLGYEVVLAEKMSTDLKNSARIVNSCDVLLGIHGAGLTNMVFLPDQAILIQIVPLGAIDGFARLDFGNPAAGMNIRYLEYKIKVEESSLSKQYPLDHPILTNPLSFHKHGWDVIKETYLENQNVTIDIHRFRATLAKALKLLRH